MMPGDGDRIIRCWKFLLIIFKSSNHPNYAKETVNLLVQYLYVFSDRLKARLKWSRCVNTKGFPGCNMPCDLHMEHLNRTIKNMVRGMGGNISSEAVVKAGKTVGTVKHVCSVFEEQTIKTKQTSESHSYPSLDKDVKRMVNVLKEEKVFIASSERQHPAFSTMNCGIMQKYSRPILIKKVKESLKKIAHHSATVTLL